MNIGGRLMIRNFKHVGMLALCAVMLQSCFWGAAYVPSRKIEQTKEFQEWMNQLSSEDTNILAAQSIMMQNGGRQVMKQVVAEVMGDRGYLKKQNVARLEGAMRALAGTDPQLCTAIFEKHLSRCRTRRCRDHRFHRLACEYYLTLTSMYPAESYHRVLVSLFLVSSKRTSIYGYSAQALADLDSSNTTLAVSKEILQAAQTIRTYQAYSRAFQMALELQGTSLEDAQTAKSMASNAYFVSKRKQAQLARMAIDIDVKVTRVKATDSSWSRSANDRVLVDKDFGIKFSLKN